MARVTLCGPMKETGAVMTAFFALIEKVMAQCGKDHKKDVNLSVTQTPRNSRILDRQRSSLVG